MQIREVRRVKSGPAWEFVRWVYDSTKGRSVPEVLGRMEQAWSTIPKEVLDKVTAAEREELDAWLRSTLEGRERDRRLLKLRYHGLADLADAMAKTPTGTLTPAEAESLWTGVQALASQLYLGGAQPTERTLAHLRSTLRALRAHKPEEAELTPAAPPEPTPIEAACAAAASRPEGEKGDAPTG